MQIDNYNIITILIGMITLLIGYYSLIANRPRIFLKSIYVNNINSNRITNFEANVNIKFINYGEKPAFNVKVNNYCESYINEFIDEVNELNLDKESSRKSLDKSLPKNERDFYQAIYLAKVNERSLYNRNKKYIESFMGEEINFIEGKSHELKKIGIVNRVSKGGLKQKSHSILVQYEDLRDLNILIKIILCIGYFILYTLFFIYGYTSFLPLTLKKISNRTGVTFNILESKYTKIFKDKLQIKIESENTHFEYDVLLNKLDNILNEIKSPNIFNDQIYMTWENNLTKSEYRIFKKYRLKYGDEVDNYINLYKERNTVLPNQASLHLKLWILIEIFYKKNAIDKLTYTTLCLIKQLR